MSWFKLVLSWSWWAGLSWSWAGAKNRNCFFNTSYRYSIGLRSGEFGGQVNTSNLLLCSSNHSWTIFALWQGALSCWKRPQPPENTVCMKGCSWSESEPALISWANGATVAGLLDQITRASLCSPHASMSFRRPWPCRRFTTVPSLDHFWYIQTRNTPQELQFWRCSDPVV